MESGAIEIKYRTRRPTFRPGKKTSLKSHSARGIFFSLRLNIFMNFLLQSIFVVVVVLFHVDVSFKYIWVFVIFFCFLFSGGVLDVTCNKKQKHWTKTIARRQEEALYTRCEEREMMLEIMAENCNCEWSMWVHFGSTICLFKIHGWLSVHTAYTYNLSEIMPFTAAVERWNMTREREWESIRCRFNNLAIANWCGWVMWFPFLCNIFFCTSIGAAFCVYLSIETRYMCWFAHMHWQSMWFAYVCGLFPSREDGIGKNSASLHLVRLMFVPTRWRRAREWNENCQSMCLLTHLQFNRKESLLVNLNVRASDHTRRYPIFCTFNTQLSKWLCLSAVEPASSEFWNWDWFLRMANDQRMNYQ